MAIEDTLCRAVTTKKIVIGAELFDETIYLLCTNQVLSQSERIQTIKTYNGSWLVSAEDGLSTKLYTKQIPQSN